MELLTAFGITIAAVTVVGSMLYSDYKKAHENDLRVQPVVVYCQN